MKKRLLPLLFFLAFGIVTFAQNVTIDIQESSNGCGLSTDCENNVACFDLIITINQPNWELASYNIWSQYPKPATMSYASDNACLTQNGGDTDDNVNGQYRVAGINGVTLLQPGVPTIFHTICYDYLDAEIIRDSVIAVGGRLSVYGFPFNTTVTLSHTITGATAGLTINTQEYLNINSNTLSCLVPDLLIEKELTSYVDNDASGTISFGDVLTYTITTTNTGNITQNNVVISDPILNPASTTCVTLPVGAQCILTGTYTVSQADVNAGKIVNVATVVSDEVGPYEASITTPIGQQPEMTINKTLLTNVTGVAGQSLVYKVVVTNTGNTTLNNVAVSDLKLTPKLAFCASVLPGQTCTLTGAYLVTQADIDAGEIVNAANAISDETPPATTEITTPVPQYPSITTVKTLLTDVSGGIAVDDLLTYSVKVTNTGNITLHNVTVSDPMLTPNSKTCATLAPAGSCTHTGTYVVKQSDIDAGQIVNTGIGDSDETGSVSSQITTTIEQKPAMIVAKQLDTDISSGVMAGDVLTYTVEITNTGNITLNNVVVSDNKITPAQATCATVAPGATCSLTGTYTLTQADIDAGEIGNTGTGDSDQTDPVTKDITTPLPQTPLLTVEKSSTGITYTAIGEEIYYTITVTNTGNVTIDNIEITDANADIGSIACSGTSLLPGEFLTCMAIHTVDMDDMLAGEVVNIAKATGDDPLGNPLSFESNEVVVTVKVLIANDDIGTPVNGNDGGVAVPNVLDNDALNGNPVIPAEIILTQISTTNPGVTLNPATGAVNVAPGTPAGNYELVYEICEIALPANCDQATVFVTVEAPEILAVADNATGINGYTGQQDVLNIFDNDLLNGVAVDPEKVTLTETSPDPTGSLTLNPDGSVDVIPGTPAGTYSLTYTICEKLNPTNCSTATVQIEVIAPEILAEDDSYSPINGYDGNPNVGNALTNDSYNGIVPASIDDVDITVLTPATPVTPGANVPVLDITTGIVSVPAQTPAGTYTIEYKICDALNPTNCDPATITVVVAPAVILAVDDTGNPVNGLTGGDAGINVLDNDKLNGADVIPVEVTITSTPTTELTVNTDGTVTVAPGTPAGTYTIDYKICEVLNPTNCDDATVEVEVTAPGILANDDDYSSTPVNGYTGNPNVGNALTNDSYNGIVPASIDDVDITVLTPATPVAPGANVPALDITTGIVSVPAQTPAGTYTIEYKICDALNPTNCDPATITVVVAPAVILAVDDTGNPVNGLTGGDAGINVLDNDKLNGADVIPVEVTITSTPTTELTVNTDGTVTVAPGTPAGTYTIDYKICEVLNPTNCDDATVEVEVTAPGILANDDDYSSTPVNGYTGNPNVGNALTNDSYNGIVPASIDDVDITVLTPATPVAPGANVPALDITTGIVSVPAQTPAGTYTIEYQICDALNPTNCDPATITVVVAPAVILAVDDTGTPINGYVGGVSVPTVFVNDLLNGAPFNPSQVTLTQISPVIPGITLNLITGQVTVAPGTPAGNYELVYKICEILNPANCDQAIVFVPVTAPEILAVDDNGPLINGVLGGVSVANVLANDLLNGILVNPALITLTQISTTNPGVTLDPITGAVNVAAGTSTGTYYVEYKICEILNPANCDQALVTVPVFQEPTVTFCLNSEEAQSSGLYTYCSTEPVAFTLCGIDAGVAPFDICYEINGVPNCVYDIALDDVIFSQLFAAGTYNITIISITDQAGYSVFDLSSYHFDFTISVGATAFAGNDAAICQGSTYDLSSATAQNASSVMWSGGDGTFAPTVNTLNVVYTPGPLDILAGSVELCLTAQSELPCTLESVDCLTLTITVPPSADAGSDIIACESDGFVMLDGVVNNAASAEWNTTSTDGFFFDENEASTIYVFGADDIANGGATLCLTATAIGPCLDPATDCLVLTIIADPTANAGSNATICEGNDYTLSGASVTNAGEVMWETFGDGMFDNPSLLNPTYTPGAADIAAGTVQLCIDAEAAQNCGTTAFDCMILTIAKLPLANPGGDLSLSCNDYDIPNGKWLPVELTNTITGDYASIQWTTDGDGTFSDPTALAPLYNPGLADIWKGDIELCVTVESVEACQTSDTKCMMLYIPQQLIYFDADGWWGVSSYLDTDLPLVSQVMDPLVLIPGSQHLVTMLDKQGKYFWPEPIPTQGNLGNWIPIGYKAKIKNPPACLPIYGDSLLNQTFTVSGAFTFLPVLTNVPVAINQLLAGHLSDILLIYDWSNKVLWTPQAADFTELFPGRAYLMVNKLATGSYTIEYPDFVPNAPHLYPTTLPKSAMIHNSPWQQESNTAVPHIMLFDNKVMSKLNSGDILAVFDSQGNCYGQTEYGNAEEVFSLIAMGRNDQLRDERAGFETGEKMFMRRYNAATGVQQAVTFVYDTDFPSSDGLFAENGASRVVDFIETATNVNDDLIMNNVTIYPNPASSEINIKAAGNIRKVELLSSTGQIIMSQSFDATQIRLDVSQYKAGVYIVAITQSSGNVITRRVTIF
jgi:uncharacterized repeat protein (TIGR01451 family)